MPAQLFTIIEPRVELAQIPLVLGAARDQHPLRVARISPEVRNQLAEIDKALSSTRSDSNAQLVSSRLRSLQNCLEDYREFIASFHASAVHMHLGQGGRAKGFPYNLHTAAEVRGATLTIEPGAQLNVPWQRDHNALVYVPRDRPWQAPARLWATDKPIREVLDGTALVVDAWWATRQDRDTERAYLQELLEDDAVMAMKEMRYGRRSMTAGTKGVRVEEFSQDLAMQNHAAPLYVFKKLAAGRRTRRQGPTPPPATPNQP